MARPIRWRPGQCSNCGGENYTVTIVCKDVGVFCRRCWRDAAPGLTRPRSAPDPRHQPQFGHRPPQLMLTIDSDIHEGVIVDG